VTLWGKLRYRGRRVEPMEELKKVGKEGEGNGSVVRRKKHRTKEIVTAA